MKPKKEKQNLILGAFVKKKFQIVKNPPSNSAISTSRSPGRNRCHKDSVSTM